MIKEKLMNALKTAAADYNGGMGANMAVTCAAQAWDFNEKQAERLVEMFNTLAALNKEKDASDPTGSCELASKDEVIRLLLGDCGNKKAASASVPRDYSFYGTNPERTNNTIEARKSGIEAVVKAASAGEDNEPAELKVSQRSLYKIISGQIDTLKKAAAAADDVVRNAMIEIEHCAIKVAKAIESPTARPDLADMFKAACDRKKAVENISEYSTKVADSDGGIFAKMHVFDSSPVDSLLKIACDIENYFSMVSEYEKKRDFYLSKAAEAESEMLEAVGLSGSDKSENLADMVNMSKKKASAKPADESRQSEDDSTMCQKIAELLKESNVSSESVSRLVDELEKDAALNFGFAVPFPSVPEAHKALTGSPGVDNEHKRLMNVRRSIILADLMTNDPIIRDADPNAVTEAYKTMVMSSPRVSLDKAQVRAFLRSAVNSVAISPSDVKTITDVDKGTALSNIENLASRMTTIDSSIKDSNV